MNDDLRFARLATIPHASVAIAVRPLLFRLSRVTSSYWILNAAAFAWLCVAWIESGAGFVRGFPSVCLGMVLAFMVLLPLHEATHALAYKLVGAGGVSVHYDLRRLSAHCIADRAVVGRASFAFVALAPTIVLTGALVVATLFMPPGIPRLLVAGAMLLHLGAASGDVALLNLVMSARHAVVWTYDDLARGESYFFGAT